MCDVVGAPAEGAVTTTKPPHSVPLKYRTSQATVIRAIDVVRITSVRSKRE